MEQFLKTQTEGNKMEFLVDNNIFNKDIVMKSAYNFLDKGYFFFKLNDNGNILVQFTKKEGVEEKIEEIIGEFSDELLSVYLRNKLEIENKEIRENIVKTAIINTIDTKGFVEIDTDNINQTNQIDFDKDIDEILREIENDPELKIDEEEIERILREIEEETEDLKENKNTITLDPNNIKNAKTNFGNK